MAHRLVDGKSRSIALPARSSLSRSLVSGRFAAYSSEPVSHRLSKPTIILKPDGETVVMPHPGGHRRRNGRDGDEARGKRATKKIPNVRFQDFVLHPCPPTFFFLSPSHNLIGTLDVHAGCILQCNATGRTGQEEKNGRDVVCSNEKCPEIDDVWHEQNVDCPDSKKPCKRRKSVYTPPVRRRERSKTQNRCWRVGMGVEWCRLESPEPWRSEDTESRKKDRARERKPTLGT